MKLSGIFGRLVVIVCLVFLFFSLDDITLAAGEIKVVLEKTPDSKRFYAYATRYRIKLDFKDSASLYLDEIEDAQTFKVVIKDTGKSVPIKRATYVGGADGGKYKGALLYGDFRPDGTLYQVTMNFPNGVTKKMDVGKSEGEKDTGGITLFHYFTDHASFTFEPMVVEDASSLGFKYNFKFGIDHWLLSQRGDHRVELALTSNGEFGADDNSEEIQSSLNGGLSLDYRYHWKTVVSVPQAGEKQSVKRQYVYPYGLRLRPVEFESNRDFDLVDYTAKLELVFSVPYSDWPVFWWHAETGVNRPFFPLLILTGYTFADEIDGSQEYGKGKTNQRWDSEVVYSFPLAQRIDFGARWRGFLNLEDDDFKHFLELSMKFYFTDSCDTGIDFSYQDGSLPPEFKDTSAFRLGLSTRFF